VCRLFASRIEVQIVAVLCQRWQQQFGNAQSKTVDLQMALSSTLHRNVRKSLAGPVTVFYDNTCDTIAWPFFGQQTIRCRNCNALETRGA
jgi:hypothetical protein